jgi:uncharacterized protein
MGIRRMGYAVAVAVLILPGGLAAANASRSLGDDGLANLDVIEEQILRAVQRKDTRKLDVAIKSLELRQRTTGGDARTLILLVQAYLERSPNFYGRKAFQAAELAVQLEPMNPEAHLARASIAIQIDCVPCAEGAIQDAERLGMPTPGIASAKASVQLMKANAIAREPGANIYIDGASEAKAQAGSFLRQAIAAEKRPIHRSSLLVWHAEVAARIDSEESSVNMLRQAIELDPDNVSALRQYATLLTFNRGEIERAAKLVASLGDMGDSSLWAIKSSAPYARWAKAWMAAPDAPHTKRLLEEAKQAAPEIDEIFQIVSMHSQYAYVAMAMLASGVYRITPAEYRDKDGDTALANAVLNAGEETTEYPNAKRLPPDAMKLIDALLTAGANANAWVSRGREPIIAVAARNGDQALVERLLKAGADPHAVGANGTTALLAAAQGKDHEAAVSIAKALIRRGVRVDATDRFQHTPLMASARAGNFELVCVLLESRAEPSRKDIDGQTALDWAAAGGHEGVASALLAAGAEINEVIGMRGLSTTIDRAMRSGNKSLVELLKRHLKKES